MEQFKSAFIQVLAAILFIPFCMVINLLVLPFLPREGGSGQYVVGSGLVVCFTVPVSLILYIALVLGFWFFQKPSVEKPKRKSKG